MVDEFAADPEQASADAPRPGRARLTPRVYWLQPGGRAIHRRADCPVIHREMEASIGVFLGARLVSCDLDEPVMDSEEPYPPEDLEACQACRSDHRAPARGAALRPGVAGLPRAHWEHGYRGHGLWIGNARLGYVGLRPKGAWDGVYRWHVEVPGSPGSSLVAGEARSLRAAKRLVERSAIPAFAAHEAWERRESADGREVAWPWHR